MIAKEFISIKNKMDICKFYDTDKFYNMFILNNQDNVHAVAARLIISIFCELESKNKYPKSSELNDLITFVNENPEAKKLKKYINDIPGYDPIWGLIQNKETYYQHRMSLFGLNELRHKSYKFSDFNSMHCLDNIISLYGEEDDKGAYLNVNSNGSFLKVEKLFEFNTKTFRVNDVMFKNIEINNFINIINYANVVKELNLENIQAAYYFLR